MVVFLFHKNDSNLITRNQYCSIHCQEQDHFLHHYLCDSPINNAFWAPIWKHENRAPAYSGKEELIDGTKVFLWGNMPAIDVLKLRENEGVTWHKDLHLLFAASGDPRNLLKTVADLPEGFSAGLNSVVNDIEPLIIYRNALLLLVLLQQSQNEELVIDTALHLWYSAFLREEHSDLLTSTVGYDIDKLCSGFNYTSHDTVSRLWTFGDCEVKLVLNLSQWETMRTYYTRKSTLHKDQAKDLRKAAMTSAYPDPQSGADAMEHALMVSCPKYRASLKHFHEDGLLLPLSHSRENFVVPNPTLFIKSDWQLRRLESPFHGWDFNDVVAEYDGLAVNDSHGMLHRYLKTLLRKFRRRIRTLKCQISLFSMDARFLSRLSMRFDRIDVSPVVFLQP